jgi:Protein of unknown function (DUF1376)
MKWYKHDPSAALAGMIGLTVEERGAYYTLIDLLYARAPHNDVTDILVIKALGIRPQTWRRLKGSLILKGKVHETDGKLTANRVQTEVLSAGLIITQRSVWNTRRKEKQRLSSIGGVDTTTTTSTSRKEHGANAPRDPEKAALYDRGKQILGPSAGGQVTRLLNLKGSVPGARAILEMAATAGNPAEYVGAVLRGRLPSVEQDQDVLLLAWCKKNGVSGCNAQEIPAILEDMNGGKPYRPAQANGANS